MSGALDSFFADYARRYTEGDVEGVTSLCLWPFVAVRRGAAIHMPDHGAVWDHFASSIAAYRRAADALVTKLLFSAKQAARPRPHQSSEW